MQGLGCRSTTAGLSVFAERCKESCVSHARVQACLPIRAVSGHHHSRCTAAVYIQGPATAQNTTLRSCWLGAVQPLLPREVFTCFLDCRCKLGLLLLRRAAVPANGDDGTQLKAP